MLSVRILKNALFLAEYRNFARAAEALSISQPTLTRSIQNLEAVVGEHLFDRGKKAVIPTQAGEIVLKHARLILASSEALQEEISRHRGILEGTLSIGAGPYAGVALIPAAVGQFQQQHKQIDISADIHNWDGLPEKLMLKEFDFILVESNPEDISDDFELIRLHKHQAFFFCRPDHPLLKKAVLKITDLSEYPLVFPHISDRLQVVFNKAFFPNLTAAKAAAKLNHVVSEDVAFIKATVSHSNSIGIASYPMLMPELEAGLYKMLPFIIPELCTSYNIIKRKGLSSTPTAIAFMELLVEIDSQQSIQEESIFKSMSIQ